MFILKLVYVIDVPGLCLQLGSVVWLKPIQKLGISPLTSGVYSSIFMKSYDHKLECEYFHWFEGKWFFRLYRILSKKKFEEAVMFAKMYHLEINVCFKFVLYLCALWNDTSDYLCSTCSSIWIFMYNLDRGVSVRSIFHQYLAHNMRVQFTWFSVITIRYWWIDNSKTCCFTIVDGVHAHLYMYFCYQFISDVDVLTI